LDSDPLCYQALLVLSAGCIHTTLLTGGSGSGSIPTGVNGGGGEEEGRPGARVVAMLVGSLRLASVWFGFFDIWALRVAVFSQTESE